MFWGLIIEPNKRYTQTVQKSFHISMAALDAPSSENSNVQVMFGLNDKNYLLCTLNSENILQTPLDLNFQDGDKIAFMHNGKGCVHLTGYLVPEDDYVDYYDEEEGDEEVEDEEEIPRLVRAKTLKRKSESESNEKKSKKKKSELAALLDETIDSDENDDSFTIENFEEASDEEDDEEAEAEADDSDDQDGEEQDENDSDEMEVEESEEEVEVKKSKKEKKQKPQLNGTKQKNKNIEKVTKKGNNQSPQTVEKAQQNNKKNENQQQKKKEKNEKKLNDSTGNGTPSKKIIEGGVHIEDLKVGTGPVAKPGKFVQVYYEGRLKSNGRQFDASKTGPGFKFRLGKKEVIQGWDVGVNGMKVGGKRRITCPPNMAYGAKGSPPVIPPNSTLVFEVELKNVN